MHRHHLRHRLGALSLGLAALLGGCGGGDALPPGATPLTPAPDTTAPSVTIVSGAAGSTAAGNVTFTFTFSENVGTTFTADDVVVTGGSKGAFAMPNGTSATLVVTPNAGTAGTLDVNVPAGRYSDLAGNLNTAVAATSQAYNTVAGAIGSGSTGGCTTAPCIDFGGAGLAMVPFGGLAAEIANDPGDAANKVIKLVKAPAAEVWAGATVDPSGAGASTVPAFGFATSKVVTLRFLSPAAGETIMLKVENSADNTVLMEAQAITTQANQWETLTFDFGAPSAGSYNAAKTYDRVSIFPHYNTKVTADSTYYADELKYTAASGSGGGGSGCGSTAPTCAPTTTVPAGAVTIYSDAAQVAGFNPKPDWGQAPPVTYTEETVAGNKSLKYGFTAPALYEGLDWAANPVDVSAKGKLHIDFWSADIGSVKVSIISNGKENAVTQAITAGSWNSVDIDLAQYTVPDKAAIIQIKLEPNVAGTLYVDNIYFWGSAPVSGCGTTEPTCAPTTTVPAGAVTIYSEAAQVAGFNPKPDWGQAPPVTYSEVTIAANKSLKYGFTAPALYEGLDWAANPVDVSAKGKLHIDFWSADIGSVKVSIISNGKENAVTQAITAGSWNSVDIDLAQYTVPDKAAIIQIKLEPNVAGTLYVDNIYFWGTAAGGGGGGAPVNFSTGFGAGNRTVEGGAFGGYSGSSLDNFGCSGDPAWCGSGGSFTPGVAAAASSFFYYYQTPSPVTALYAGVFIQAPGLTTGLSPTADTAGVSIAGKATMKFTLGQNAEWFSSPTNNFGVILTLGKFYDVDGGPAVQACNIKLLAVVTPTAAAASNYAIPLSSFEVIQNCNVAGLGVAAALALSPLSQVDFQAVGSSNPLPAVGGKLVGANMSVGTAPPVVYPSTIALGGGITFE